MEQEQRQRSLLQQRLDEVCQEMQGMCMCVCVRVCACVRACMCKLKYFTIHMPHTHTEQWSEIQTCLTEMEGCFQLFLPRFDLTQSDTHTHTIQDLGLFESSSSEKEEEEEEKEEKEKDEEEKEEEEKKKDEAKKDEEEKTQCHKCVLDKQSTMVGSVSSGVQDTRTSDSDDSDEEDWEEVEGNDKDELQEHGITGHSYNLTIELPRMVEILENTENTSIISTLRERHHMVINRYLPAVCKWIQVRRWGEAWMLLALDCLYTSVVH